jgi:predicted nuclease with TOPRIM domain
MVDVSLDLVLEVVNSLQERVIKTDAKMDELRGEMQAFRGHMISLQQDVHNIYGILARNETRFDRIERRLELSSPALP